MSKNGKLAGALADPSQIKAVNGNDQSLIQVVIETPKGSRNKYAFDKEQKIFQLKKVLPAGMSFPYDFGFLPGTLGDDGDPLDVLVLMDEPAFPGCALKCRVLGIIEGKQGRNRKTERNDRIVAVEHGNHSFDDVRVIDDLGKKFLKELEEFFVNYHKMSGQQFQVIDVRGPKHARKRIEIGIRAERRH